MISLPSLTGSILIDWSLISLVLFALASIRSYYRLSHIPGPKLWGWTVLPLFKTHLDGVIYEKFGQLNEQYGPLVRIAPNTLLTSDPNQLRRMSAPRTSYSRSDWFLVMRLIPGQDNIISTRNDKYHEDLRRKMAAGYSGKECLSLEKDIDDCIFEFIQLIEKKYTSTPEQYIPMDLAQKCQFLTADIMSKLSFDAKFHDLRDDNDNFGYINEVETAFPNMFCTCTIPKFIDFLTKIGLLKLLAPSTTSNLGFGKIISITKVQTAKRFDTDGKKKIEKQDMIGSFIRHGIDQNELEHESVIQLVAGTDTSATGMRATLLCIITNPPVYTKLKAGIDEAIKNGNNPLAANEIISDMQARKLPYLQACIKEGLRWYPPVAGLLAKKTPPEGDIICGYRVPGGVAIGYSAKGIHHSKALFGPDEHIFRPERWILTSQGGDEPSIEKIKEMERNNDLIFGYGKYLCLGKTVALIELNKIYVELFRRFDITMMNPLKPWKTSCYGIHLQSALWVTVKRRE